MRSGITGGYRSPRSLLFSPWNMRQSQLRVKRCLRLAEQKSVWNCQRKFRSEECFLIVLLIVSKVWWFQIGSFLQQVPQEKKKHTHFSKELDYCCSRRLDKVAICMEEADWWQATLFALDMEGDPNGRNEKEERSMHHRFWGNKVCWCWGSRRSELERWADKEGRMFPVVFHHMHIYIHIYVFKYIGFVWPLMTGRTQNSHIFITNAPSYFLDVAVSHLGYRKFYRVHFLPSQTT